jgi:hypothetical protein
VPHRSRSRRLHLDALEDRNLLSICTVDHLADDMVGDGLTGSLRYCITNATDGDTIDFGVNGTINLTGALPNLTHSISIEGPGPDLLMVRGNTRGRYAIFTVASSTTVNIAGLSITNGYFGISNSGTFTLNNATVSDNSDDLFLGGGIYNAYGTMTVSNSTIAYNRNGNGVINNLGTMTVSNSTIAGNYFWFDLGPDYGGGIANHGTLTLNNSTVSGNSAEIGGGIYNSGTLHARNTIIAGNTAFAFPDLYGNLGSLGHNLIGNTQGGSGFDDTNLLNVNPLLGPLQDNGGPTKTMALLPGSPAIDAGDNTDAPDWDQRGEGFPRIVGVIDPDNPVIDIGAYEVQGGGDGPPRLSRPAVTPLPLQVAALLDTPPLQSVSSLMSETKPDAAVVNALFANDGAMQPGAAIARPTVGDALMSLHRQLGSNQDFTEADAFNLFGVFLID